MPVAPYLDTPELVLHATAVPWRPLSSRTSLEMRWSSQLSSLNGLLPHGNLHGGFVAPRAAFSHSASVGSPTSSGATHSQKSLASAQVTSTTGWSGASG